MTTLFIILSVIRRAALERVDTPKLADQIQNSYLINQYANSDDERDKLIPTQRDRASFTSLIDDQEPDLDTAIGRATAYFADALSNGDSKGTELDLRKLFGCIIGRLDMVSIYLEDNDSPNRIFESLNNTGMPLNVADLIRNFLLMNIPNPQQQEDAYNEYWRPMENLLSDASRKLDKSPDFFWRYLMMDGSRPRIDDTYDEIQKRLSNGNPNAEEVLDTLKDFKRFARPYAQITGLSHEGIDENVLEGMQRLNQWVADVAYPPLMRLFDALGSGSITSNDLTNVIGMIESFLVRRSVCGIPTNQLRRIFALMSGQVNSHYGDVTGFVHGYLSTNRWPSDDEFRSRFVDFSLYSSSSRRTRLVLNSLERSFGHKETPDLTSNITIEHIMPQSLPDWWKSDLGPNYSEIHTQWVHTVGNLTLSGYNPNLGNRPFNEKTDMLAKSNFALSDSILQVENWDAAAIQQRGEMLADRALGIWKR